MAHVSLDGGDEVENCIAIGQCPASGTQPNTGISAECWLKVFVGGYDEAGPKLPWLLSPLHECAAVDPAKDFLDDIGVVIWE